MELRADYRGPPWRSSTSFAATTSSPRPPPAEEDPAQHKEEESPPPETAQPQQVTTVQSWPKWAPEFKARNSEQLGVWGTFCDEYPKLVTATTSFVALSALIFVITILSMSIERVDSKYYAVTYSPITGQIGNGVRSEGLHTKPAFGQFLLWPKTYATSEQNVDCNSKDGVRISLRVSFQYLPRSKEIVELTKLYEDDDGYKGVLVKHARSAIRNSCAEFVTQEFQTQRGRVQASIYDSLLTRLAEQLETDVIDVQLSNIERPESYENEVALKEASRNDIDQAENEREQALTRARTKLLQAQTSANRTIDTAETNAVNTLNRADADAAVVTDRYAALAASYAHAKSLLDLDDDALLAYVHVRLTDLATTAGSATVAVDTPAFTS